MAKNTFSHQNRSRKIQKQLIDTQVALISKPTDLFYLTDFPQLSPTEREAFLLIKPQAIILFHHSFSPTLPTGRWLTKIPSTQLTQLAEHLKESLEVLLDEQTLTVAEFKNLKNQVAGRFTTLNPKWLSNLRLIKDRTEQEQMRKAGQITAKIMAKIGQTLKVGMTEQMVARKISQEALKEQDVVGLAFPTIVAFGQSGALPHYQPGNVKLKRETPVLVDFGVNVGGYFSDMTRTFWFGRQPTAKFLEIKQVVQEAYNQAWLKLKKHQGELTAKDLDDAARGVVAQRGYGEQFIHNTGHGLGLEIHEPPSLAWNNPAPIKPNMIITIEPGIYLPGQFGYRHENTVLI
ncbi:MAG TPA: M24 family metallopeptidase, partial [Patescibacteria group bacterium]